MAYIQDWGMRVQAQPQINTTRRSFLHLSQNENGRMLNIRITDVNIPTGSTAVLAGTKPDGTVYSQTGTLAGNTATFAEDVQMTAVAGTWDAKITITNGGNCICTARITITIDPDTVAGGAIPSDSQLDGIIAECRAIADSVRKEAYGSPLVADAVEDMTDQSRVYVYTGSETGYTSGHWYYYNGTAWADGGVYNSIAVDTDTTLSIAGKAADAKKVGDELADVKEDLTYKSLQTYPQNAGALGASTTWVNVNTSTYKHIAVPVKSGDAITVTANTTSYTRIGLLKNYSVPTSNSDVMDFSAQTGFTARIMIAAETSYAFNVPSDATYLIILTLDNGDNAFPASCVINGLDYCKGFGTVVQGINAVVDGKSAWDDLGVKSIDLYEAMNGLINSSGNWGGITNAYKHIVIPIKSGDVIDIECNVNRATYIGFLKSYTIPTNGVSADFSTQTGFTARIAISTNVGISYTVPSDAKFLYYLVVNDSVDAKPVSLKINGYDITKRLDATIVSIQQEIDANKYLLFNKLDYAPVWESGAFTFTAGSTSSNQSEVTRQRMVKYGKNAIPTILHTDGTFTTNLVLYNDDMTVKSKTEYTKADKVIPANTIYRILLADGVSNQTDISGYTSAQINTHITVQNTQFYDLINPAVSWCAMGDSITEGFVSYLDDQDEPTYKIDKDLAWVYKVAKINGWKVTNLGVGGTGWNKATNAEVQQGVDTTSAHYIAEHTDFTPFNLVTLSYGINDWKANYQTGTIDGDYTTPTTTIGGMRATIDAIIESNPHCKIIVILPLNCAGYRFNYGDESTNWSLGYSFSNSGTLEQFVQALISVCDYYGIQYIDMAHYSCVNRKNLLDCLTDGVHPNAETHELLARELCKKITFG